ncbi:UNVERIFIED_CONTAM: hypothetical protein FKN15_045681 [Acipenser sinensis]
MFAQPGDSMCLVNSFKKIFTKVPIGVNYLGNMMPRISEQVAPSVHYTNHSAGLLSTYYLILVYSPGKLFQLPVIGVKTASEIIGQLLLKTAKPGVGFTKRHLLHSRPHTKKTLPRCRPQVPV